MNEFILSDESLNSYGFKVLTDGINLTRFLQNPVMYYNHQREKGVIGRWENVHIRDKKLYGTAVFDEKDAFALSIAEKVTGGFLKAASIGISNIEATEENGEVTIKKCDLQECSICDIPSNENALILYDGDRQISDKNEIMRFSVSNKKDGLSIIKQDLGLSEKSTISDILNTIRDLKDCDNIENCISKAVELKYIESSEVNSLSRLSKSNPKEIFRYLDERKKAVLKKRQETGIQIINKAIVENRIVHSAKEFWLRNYSDNPDETEKVLSQLHRYRTITGMINEANTVRGSWTLSDYRKYAPGELKKNPELYKALIEDKKKNKKQ